MIEMAKTMWKAGDSAGHIARVLGKGLSSNAVIGKLYRMGLGGRATPTRRINTHPKIKPAVAAARYQKPAAPPVAKAPAKPAKPEPAPSTAVVRIEQLEGHHCRYPLGDPQAPAFGFCGAKHVEGRPYCQPHCEIAYAPQAAAKRQKTGFDFTRAK
jgi:GcrA cell cycle regulator